MTPLFGTIVVIFIFNYIWKYGFKGQETSDTDSSPPFKAQGRTIFMRIEAAEIIDNNHIWEQPKDII